MALHNITLRSQLIAVIEEWTGASSEDLTRLYQRVFEATYSGPGLGPPKGSGRGTSLGTRSDLELLDGFVCGEQEAFTVLWKRHSGELLGYALRSLGREDAEDALVSSFVVLAKKAQTMDRESNIRAYLFSCLRLEILQILRKNTRNDRIVEVAGYDASVEDGVLERIVLEARRDGVAQALFESCNDLEQEVILLLMDGLRPAEVAEALDIPPSHARALKTRAIRKLQDALHRQGGLGEGSED